MPTGSRRAPNSEWLDLEKAGVVRDDGGYIPTDLYQQTNVEHIFALGDVTGRAQLTPVAIAAGRRLADRLYGGMEGRHLDYELIPTVIFSHPTIGTVGMTEDQARETYGDDVKVYTSGFVGMYYALGEDKVRSAMKLIVAGDEVLFGLGHALLFEFLGFHAGGPCLRGVGSRGKVFQGQMAGDG